MFRPLKQPEIFLSTSQYQPYLMELIGHFFEEHVQEVTEGVCFGFAVQAAIESAVGNLDSFKKTMAQLVKNINQEVLSYFRARASGLTMEGVQAPSALGIASPQEERYFELAESLIRIQCPYLFPDHFGGTAPSSHARLLMDYLEFIVPEDIHDAGVHLSQASTTTSCFSREALAEYFEELEVLARTGGGNPISFLLLAQDHAITLVYDPRVEGEQWTLLDAGGKSMDPIARAALPEAIFKAFFAQEEAQVIFMNHIFHTDLAPEKINDCFQSDKMAELHEVMPASEEIAWQWFITASVESDVDTVNKLFALRENAGEAFPFLEKALAMGDECHIFRSINAYGYAYGIEATWKDLLAGPFERLIKEQPAVILKLLATLPEESGHLKTALLVSISAGNKEVFDALLARDMDLNFHKPFGILARMSPLALAASLEKPEMLDALLAHGARKDYSFGRGTLATGEKVDMTAYNFVTKILPQAGTEVNPTILAQLNPNPVATALEGTVPASSALYSAGTLTFRSVMATRLSSEVPVQPSSVS
jgi:hypothetical protein